MGVLNLPDELLTAGELGSFQPLPIMGWDKARTDVIDILRKSYEWNSTKLIRTILSCYHNAGMWFSSLRVFVTTVDKWLTGMSGTIPPHQMFTWEIDGAKVRGFIYVGPKLEIIEGDIINVDELKEPLNLYNEIFNNRFSLCLNDEEVERFLECSAEDLYKKFVHGDSPL